jgi:hypothetical protein
MDARKAGRWRGWPLVAILLASVAFRLPALANARETNSDAAVVGLQAMHLLRGEWSWFLWGSGYQTSIDSAFAALAFGLLGPSPLALMLTSFGLHLALTALAFWTLERRLDPALAALSVLPLVFTSSPSQTYILYPPRQAALTIAVAAIWALDRAADARRARAFVAGGALLGLACFADPYAIVLAPPIAAFGAACAWERGAARASCLRLAALVAGGSLGAVPLFLLRASSRATPGQLALRMDVLARNLRLLADPCLPWASGARAWSAPNAVDYVPWDGPLAARALGLLGGTAFVVAIAAGGACVFVARIPWSVRRLAIAGALALPVTVAGFLVSPMVMDLFSARYLAAIPLLAPFALAPLAYVLRARRFASLLAPCVAATGIAGWVGYGPFLRGRDRPEAPGRADEAALEEALTARGVHFATADYWVAYRLTLLTRERLVVVPTNLAEDRYPPYRSAFDAAPLVAYVFDPVRSREPASWGEEHFVGGETPKEIVRAGRFTALVVRR